MTSTGRVSCYNRRETRNIAVRVLSGIYTDTSLRPLFPLISFIILQQQLSMDDVEGVAQPATVGGQSPNWLRFVADPSPVSTATGAAGRGISRRQRAAV